MEEIIETVMEQEGLTRKEAIRFVKEVRTRLRKAVASGSYDEAEEILSGELGLEMDYLFDLI